MVFINRPEGLILDNCTSYSLASHCQLINNGFQWCIELGRNIYCKRNSKEKYHLCRRVFATNR